MKAAQVKTGTIIEIEKKFFKVLKFSHAHIGRGKANVELQIKNILTGQSLVKRFKSDEELEDVEIEKKELEYVYKKGNTLYFFADAVNGKKDKLEIESNIGESALFLKKGMKVIGLFNDDEFLSIELPIKETYKVVSAPPGVKGNTAQGGSKAVDIDSGAKVSVPFFIKEGDAIVVNTETGEYVSRVQ